jgi:hypothetical protein
MAAQRDMQDRRKHRRFPVKKGAFIDNGTKSGMITDISEGGLTFRYVDRKAWNGESKQLTIVFDGDDFQLDNIPCRTISDFFAPNDQPEKSAVIRRHGIQFGKLTQGQQERLRHFIRKYTDPGFGERQLAYT